MSESERRDNRRSSKPSGVKARRDGQPSIKRKSSRSGNGPRRDHDGDRSRGDGANFRGQRQVRRGGDKSRNDGGSFRGKRHLEKGHVDRRHESRDDEKRYEVPKLPVDIDVDHNELSRGVRAELRGLRADTAELVADYLVMVGRLIEVDPKMALEYAQAAKMKASRLPVVREALAEVAYAAEKYDVALAEFRALRRLTGNDEYLPVLADCERAAGRIDAAMKLIKDGLARVESTTTKIELCLVESGIRRDQGQIQEAIRILKTAIIETGKRGSKYSRARLRYAYADLLETMSDVENAEKWFETAALLDEEDQTGAQERLALLQGVEIFENFEDDEDDPNE